MIYTFSMDYLLNHPPIPIHPPGQPQHNHLQHHKRNKQNYNIIFRWRAEQVVGVGKDEKSGHDPQSTACVSQS